jgi:predicted transposase YbfD/YdcC
VQRLALFGPPPLLEGEDAAAYDQLLARVYAVVKPVDVIDEMFIADVVFLEWEVLRWRRLKSSLIRARGLEALEGFLAGQLDYDLYSEHFADQLAEILRDNLPEDQVEDAQTLARECARNEADAVDKVNELLARISLDMDNILDDAKGCKAKVLVQEYVRREPDAVTQVLELLTDAGVSMDGVMADALAENLDAIERIDHLTTIAESRRNVSLHEIDRRRAVLGETLRRSVQEIEDGEFEAIETTPAKESNAA